jgi:hypothetical protein
VLDSEDGESRFIRNVAILHGVTTQKLVVFNVCMFCDGTGKVVRNNDTGRGFRHTRGLHVPKGDVFQGSDPLGWVGIHNSDRSPECNKSA